MLRGETLEFKFAKNILHAARQKRARTICFIAPFCQIMKASALVYLHAAVPSLLWPVVAAFTRIAAADGCGRSNQEESEQRKASERETVRSRHRR